MKLMMVPMTFRYKSKMIRKKPYCIDTCSNLRAASYGRRAIRTFDPSKGGIGSKLKTARTKLIWTPNSKMPKANWLGMIAFEMW